MVLLKKGSYEVVVIMSAPDGDHDAFYITFDDSQKRLYPNGYNEIMETESMRISVSEDKEYKVKIFPAEVGMTIDRVVFRKVR